MKLLSEEKFQAYVLKRGYRRVPTKAVGCCYVHPCRRLRMRWDARKYARNRVNLYVLDKDTVFWRYTQSAFTFSWLVILHNQIEEKLLKSRIQRAQLSEHMVLVRKVSRRGR
jgi:hypothetical protein